MWTHRRSGLINQRGQDDHRNPYERDRTRVIHCPSFRRLQRKTQILGTDEGDFHRTRLTHSLEVASIGRSISRSLALKTSSENISAVLPNDDLISVICLLHDIGHPPFGHGGEVALNFMMREHGGFEGNGQTLRLLTKVENSYGEYGLDLTRRSLLGVLKYPVSQQQVLRLKMPEIPATQHSTIRINDWLPAKAYYHCEQPEVDWLLDVFSKEDTQLFQSLKSKPSSNAHGSAAFHSLDCSIMNMADDIAYGVHDLEDAIHLRLINQEHLSTPEFIDALEASSLTTSCTALLKQLFSSILAERKHAIGMLVNYFITTSQMGVNHPDLTNPLLRYTVTLTPEALRLLDFLHQCIYNNVIDSQEARTFEYGGQTVVLRLFEAISSNPMSLLDKKNRLLYQHALDTKPEEALRVVCDYIANMTDEYAYRMHERLFGFNTRTIFERL